MALFSEAMVPKDGTILMQDATGTPIAITVAYEDGDFAFSSLQEAYWETETFYDRGIPYSERKTKTQDITWSFTAHATDFTDGTEKTIMDAVLKKGTFASGVSKLGASADVWALLVKFTAERTDYGGGADNYVSIAKNRVGCAFNEGIPGLFKVDGKVILTDPVNDITWA